MVVEVRVVPLRHMGQPWWLTRLRVRGLLRVVVGMVGVALLLLPHLHLQLVVQAQLVRLLRRRLLTGQQPSTPLRCQGALRHSVWRVRSHGVHSGEGVAGVHGQRAHALQVLCPHVAPWVRQLPCTHLCLQLSRSGSSSPRHDSREVLRLRASMAGQACSSFQSRSCLCTQHVQLPNGFRWQALQCCQLLLLLLRLLLLQEGVSLQRLLKFLPMQHILLLVQLVQLQV